RMSGREAHALANILDEKLDDLGEDYAKSLDELIHGDGSADPKSLAGIQSLILDNPGVGSTGGLIRVAHPWWRNRAATAAYGNAGGQGEISVDPSNGGALIEFLDKEVRQLKRYARRVVTWLWFAGSDFFDGYKSELRANGYYIMNMSSDSSAPDGSMADPRHAGRQIVYDPTLDDMGLSKRCYLLAVGRSGLQLL